MDNIIKIVNKKIRQIVISLTVVGILLLILSFLTVWTTFMAKLVMGMVILLLAYAFLSTAYRLWKIQQDIKDVWQIKDTKIK
ncbi:hypothetical protein KBI31_01370 [Patescibacteria group bacterium]|jgi:uncharacterized membrane protein|nr:hypothetical protein [Patescibacteria group bacterium]HPD07859.1 hypothetical protein [bacterium]HRT11129.1 hypothetical protein [Patescibacteria group bacterium]HRU89968.1 hypothetical protein [Patescibacteria group bacterium]